MLGLFKYVWPFITTRHERVNVLNVFKFNNKGTRMASSKVYSERVKYLRWSFLRKCSSSCPSTIFVACSILDIWLDSEFTNGRGRIAAPCPCIWSPLWYLAHSNICSSFSKILARKPVEKSFLHTTNTVPKSTLWNRNSNQET